MQEEEGAVKVQGRKNRKLSEWDSILATYKKGNGHLSFRDIGKFDKKQSQSKTIIEDKKLVAP